MPSSVTRWSLPPQTLNPCLLGFCPISWASSWGRGLLSGHISMVSARVSQHRFPCLLGSRSGKVSDGFWNWLWQVSNLLHDWKLLLDVALRVPLGGVPFPSPLSCWHSPPPLSPFLLSWWSLAPEGWDPAIIVFYPWRKRQLSVL